MEAIAKTKYLKGSPRKARLVIDLIRGTNVSRALSILKFTDKRAADPIAQCLNSAIANATYKAEQQNIAIDPDDLWVKTCFVDMGPTKGRRRMRPAPQGRAYREQRHYCHITIEVTSEEKAKSEEQIRLDALRDERIAARKAEKAKKKAAAPIKKETKAAKIEEKPAEEVVETPVTKTPVEETPAEETPVKETLAEEIAETAPEEVAETESPADVVEENKAEIDAEVSAAHETSTHTTAEENAEKPADEAMEKTNEDLERQ
jgi:large subunit ribosomal protein L22